MKPFLSTGILVYKMPFLQVQPVFLADLRMLSEKPCEILIELQKEMFARTWVFEEFRETLLSALFTEVPHVQFNTRDS